MARITVGEAIRELDMLKKRIEAGLTADFVASVPGDMPADRRNELNDALRANWASVRSLMDRYRRIKRAVVLSNATTQIRVGEEDLTVAEALELKSRIVQYTALGTAAAKQLAVAEKKAAEHDAVVADTAAKIFGGKDTLPNAEMIEAYSAPRRAVIVGITRPRERAQEMTAFADSFRRDVDQALNASNALTFVEIGE